MSKLPEREDGVTIPQLKSPRCAFYERTAVEGGYRYTSIHVQGPPGGGGYLHTDHPPVPGDLIHLWDSLTDQGGPYQVVARHWLHSSYGSPDWPYDLAASTEGPLVYIVVEPAEGVFRNEIPREEEEEEAE
jgi:hypothetical protein